MTIQASIANARSFRTADELGPHVSQVALDGAGEYMVLTTSSPARLANQLRGIADHIEQMEET